MKQIRLLPVVIVAALALLVLKGIGLVTQGGYVLTGVPVAEAAGAAGTEGAADGTTLTLPPTIRDSVPTLDDGVPTLGLGGANGQEEAGGTHGASADDRLAGPIATACEDAPASAPGGADPGVDPTENCIPMAGIDEHGDAMPLTLDGAGNIVPLAMQSGSESEEAILERLAERRGTLEQRESELEMRMALVEAAEKRIAERTASLESLEARINAMVDEKRMLEERQFVAVVAMYEVMKPKDAAAIFDQLEMDVLLRVARSMSPRKMAPILAKMDPMKAKDVTAGLAVDQVEPTIELGQENLAALPQIIGQ